MYSFEDIASASVSAQGLTLVKSSLQLSGYFLVQQYVLFFLKRGYAVVLITAEHGLERVKTAAKKLSVNLQQYQQFGFLTCVEPPLTQLHEPHRDEAPQADTPPSGADDSSGGSSGPEGATGRGGSELRLLHVAVSRAVEQRPAAAAGVAVVVDSLTVLASLRRSQIEWSAFLHYLSPCPAEREPYCLIAGVYDDVPEDRPWLTSLEHRAEAVVHVAPLPGRIADVDGMVAVRRRCLGRRPGAGGKGGSERPRGDPSRGDSDPRFVEATAGPVGLLQSVYFRSTDLAIKWIDRVTDREML